MSKPLTLPEAIAAGLLNRERTEKGDRITTPDRTYVVWESRDRFFRYRWALSREALGWKKSKGHHGGASTVEEVLATLTGMKETGER